MGNTRDVLNLAGRIIAVASVLAAGAFGFMACGACNGTYASDAKTTLLAWLLSVAMLGVLAGAILIGVTRR